MMNLGRGVDIRQCQHCLAVTETWYEDISDFAVEPWRCPACDQLPPAETGAIRVKSVDWEKRRVTFTCE